MSAIYPLKGHEGAIGHNLFLDPNRRPDSFKTVAGAPGVTLSNPVVLTLQGEKGRAAFARYPVFVDGPIENRTESFGAPDAYECYEKCYGDPNKVGRVKGRRRGRQQLLSRHPRRAVRYSPPTSDHDTLTAPPCPALSLLQVFWGFTVALVDFDKLLESTGLTKLEDEGACFVLRTSSIGNGTDLVSNNATIYSSACVSSNLVRIPVIVPNNRWFLEIGYSQGCKTWVVPVSVAYSVAMALLLLVGLYSVYQALKNSVLIQQHHDVELSHLRERQEQVVREEVTAASDSMRWLVSSLCNIMAEKSAASSGVAHDKPPNRLTSHSTSLFKYSSVSFTFKSSNRKSFSVSSNLWNLVALKASDATSLRYNPAATVPWKHRTVVCRRPALSL